MTSRYRQNALDALGEDYAPLLDAVAGQLHRNEYPQLHDPTQDVDSHCWMRAEQALAALRDHDSLHVVTDGDTEPPETATVPYGWALWRPGGGLHGYVRADQAPGITDGWDAVHTHYADAEAWRHLGWNVDPISEADYKSLSRLQITFGYPGMREEFLTQTRAAEAQAARGLPPVTGYAAWAEDRLIAAHPAVHGLNGWHSLGIGSPADHVSMLALYGEEYQQLTTFTSRYTGPGGQQAFLDWRHRTATAEELAEPAYPPSPLARAFSGAIFDHGTDADYGDTPHLVLGQYLEDCLSAYTATLKVRAVSDALR